MKTIIKKSKIHFISLLLLNLIFISCNSDDTISNFDEPKNNIFFVNLNEAKLISKNFKPSNPSFSKNSLIEKEIEEITPITGNTDETFYYIVNYVGGGIHHPCC